MRLFAWMGGVVVFGGLIVMAVAGFPGAVPILVSAAALVAMIGLGGVMGGRHTPNVPPVASGQPAVGSAVAAGPGDGDAMAAGEGAGEGDGTTADP